MSSSISTAAFISTTVNYHHSEFIGSTPTVSSRQGRSTSHVLRRRRSADIRCEHSETTSRFSSSSSHVGDRTPRPSKPSTWRNIATTIATLAATLIPISPAKAQLQFQTATTKSVIQKELDNRNPSASSRLLAISNTSKLKTNTAATNVGAPAAISVVGDDTTPVVRGVNELRRRAISLGESVRLILKGTTESASHDHEDSGHGAAINDALVLLLTTVVIIPLTNRFGISPILGFLAAGIALGPNGFGLIRDLRTSKALAELGVVFFLFEMGLELSTSKLKSLGADVFGLGTSQFLITGAIISFFVSALGMPSQTAIVIGAGLALSSSAFVLQLLSERGEVGTRYGRAAFGILLFQDLAVVPVLVLTPLLAGSGGAAAVFRAISIASAKAAVALAFIFFMGKNFLQPAFRFVARSKSSEAFIAAILFSVLATSSLTQVLGLSDTLGAFLAGVMLAETKFRHQIEADIKPFRGLLLGLFFITVGFSIDLNLAFAKIVPVASMVSGLLLAKTSVIAIAGIAFGLSVGTALRTGLLLSQGGEFAFVIYGLAMRVGVVPTDMGQLMLLVVALSMGMTPLLAEIGRRISSSLEKKRGLIGVRMEDADTADARDFVMVAGWGRVGQSVCEMLDAKLVRYMAFDMSPTRVIDARNKGLPVFFGDARRPEVLRSAGVERARAVVVTLDDPEQALEAVQNIRREFEGVQVFCRARDSRHQKLLQAAGALAIVPELLEASLLLGGAVLLDYGTPIEEVNSLIEEARAANVEAIGMGGSITATLSSSFKQLGKLQEPDSAKDNGDAGKHDDDEQVDDDNGYAVAESGEFGETTFEGGGLDSAVQDTRIIDVDGDDISDKRTSVVVSSEAKVSNTSAMDSDNESVR